MSKKSNLPVKMQLSVVIAQYDESDSDGLDICNVARFNNSYDAAKFIVDDYNDSFQDYADLTLYDASLSLEEVHDKIKRLKINETAEWDGPEDTPLWIKWKVFRHSKRNA